MGLYSGQDLPANLTVYNNKQKELEAGQYYKGD